jgi:CubicO group peptidase (beta-lactamase class C family)
MNAALLLLPLLTQDAAVQADRLAPLHEYLSQRIEDGAFMSVVAAVEIDGERAFTHSEGEVEPDAIFRIFSMTKPITAVVALTLVDEGKLDLDAPLGEYLPEFAEPEVLEGDERVPAERPITVRDLFRHTSGLTYGLFGDSPVDRMVSEADLYSGNLTRFAELLSALPLKHQPGTRFEYSLSCDVLGRVIEVVSGKSLPDVFQARIFDPLGMVDTGFSIPEDDVDRIPTLYGRTGEGLVEQEDTRLPPPHMEPPLYLGGAGLYSTADDYLRFCQMLLQDGALGEVRVLKEETVEEMFQDQLGERPGALMLAGSGFGLGLAVIRRTPRGAGPGKSTGWWGGIAGTGFWIDRERDVAGVFMIQSWMELGHRGQFQSAVYRALK